MGSDNLTVDLFGDVTTLPSGGRGRPAHRWSQRAENVVILGLAMGYTDAQIADGLGVSPPTLRKYYFSTLKRRRMQRARFDLWRAATLADLANAGNVTALKELGKVMIARDRHLAEERMRESDDANKVGKKAAQIAAAEAALESDDLLKPGYGPN